MQKTLYRIQFSHHSMTKSQSVPEQQSRNPEFVDFANFVELPKKRLNSQQSSNSPTREASNAWKREKGLLFSSQPPFIN